MISPLEVPIHGLQIQGLWSPTEQLMCETVRGISRDIKMNMAPRGNLSRRHGSGKGKKRRMRSLPAAALPRWTHSKVFQPAACPS
eukprot:5024781-Pyramimonas_sp.AAC.1